jgi:hypothetical protein
MTSCSLLCVLALAGAAAAQPFEITSYVIAGGGGASTGGGFTLHGTIGQHDASLKPMTGGAFTLTGGFWARVSSGVRCVADCDESGVLDFFDFLCFQNQFAVGDPKADCDGTGVLDFFDFLCFQNEFAMGCP